MYVIKTRKIPSLGCTEFPHRFITAYFACIKEIISYRPCDFGETIDTNAQGALGRNS